MCLFPSGCFWGLFLIIDFKRCDYNVLRCSFLHVSSALGLLSCGFEVFVKSGKYTTIISSSIFLSISSSSRTPITCTLGHSKLSPSSPMVCLFFQSLLSAFPLEGFLLLCLQVYLSFLMQYFSHVFFVFTSLICIFFYLPRVSLTHVCLPLPSWIYGACLPVKYLFHLHIMYTLIELDLSNIRWSLVYICPSPFVPHYLLFF